MSKNILSMFLDDYGSIKINDDPDTVSLTNLNGDSFLFQDNLSSLSFVGVNNSNAIYGGISNINIANSIYSPIVNGSNIGDPTMAINASRYTCPHCQRSFNLYITGY